MAFARPLADSGENGNSQILLDRAPNEFHYQHGLADTRAAKHPRLAAPRKRSKKIHYLKSGAEDFALVVLAVDGGRVSMNWPPFDVRSERAKKIDWMAQDIDK